MSVVPPTAGEPEAPQDRLQRGRRGRRVVNGHDLPIRGERRRRDDRHRDEQRVEGEVGATGGVGESRDDDESDRAELTAHAAPFDAQ